MKVFELNSVSLNNLNTFKKREIVLKHLVKYGIQRVHTPFSLVNYMIPKDLPESVCVIFNLEFLEVLKFSRKYDMTKVTFFGDSEVEVLFAKKIYNVENSFLVNEETWNKIIKKEIDVKEVFMSKMKEAPDITFSNPPYENKDLKIIKALAESNCLKNLICVHPSVWLIEMKSRFNLGGLKLFKDFRELVRNYLEQVEFFDPNPIFNTGITTDCVISKINFIKKNENIKVKFKKEKDFFYFKNIEDITLHEKKWFILKDLKEKLLSYIEKNGSFETNRISTQEAKEKFFNSFFVQLGIMVKNSGVQGKSIDIKDEKSCFFIFSQLKINKEQENGLKCSQIPYSKDEIVFVFKTKEEKENFLKTIKTDFMRLCLSILKINSSLHRGELSLVPWLDFSKSWTDDELFSMFDFEKGHPLREYSKNFINNYHNIYPNGKDY